ncbi:SRPBCC family protein [Mycolicibacterium palauense]|uniref:hypothetical protein n=1 Tax=Mycolicibacterium palauense TaxID=2034511 RepID=UPI000BFECC7C|nr:hypothetical protein [Mycolicibacterium palauense]
MGPTAATRAERTAALPGDELIGAPIVSLTHAVTLAAPPDRVWQWLAQMGAGRAGWYSYDRLDNAGVPSAERIIPELARLRVGDVMPALPGATDAFVVAAVDEPRHLVLGVPGPYGHRASWAFVLRPVPAGTRLLVRARVGRLLLNLPLVGTVTVPGPLAHAVAVPVHGIMQRRQLLGLRRRIEG